MTYFGPFANDDGRTIDLSWKTKYHTDLGHSSTSQFRRFYLDTGPWAGATLTFNARFYANFATNVISLTRPIYASGSPYSGPQQSRIDFGIPAKSLSTEVVHGSTQGEVIVYGFTVESRFQRKV